MINKTKKNAVAFGAATLLFALSVAGPASASFTTVTNVNSGETLPNGTTALSDTQINVFDGGTVGFSLNAGEPDQFSFDGNGDIVGVTRGTSTNVEININGGFVNAFMDANNGSTINISGGTVGDAGGSAFNANFGSVVNISGGIVRSGFTANEGSTVNLSGGTLEGVSSMQASVLHMTGGTLGPSFDIGGDDFATIKAVANVSGGTLASNLEVFSDGELNLFGTQFSVSGTDITPSLTLGEAFTITTRGSSDTLTGVLADGSAFSLDLTPGFDSSNPSNDGFFAGSTLTVTLVPEPSSAILLGLGMIGLSRRRRKA